MSPDPTDSNKAIQPRKFCSLSKNWQKLVRKRVCVCWKIVNRDVWDLAIVLVRCGSNSNKLRAWMRWSGWFPILITTSSLKTSTFSIPFFKVWAIRNQWLGELLFPPKLLRSRDRSKQRQSVVGQGFFSRIITIHKTAGEGRGLSYSSTTSTRSPATLYVRWLHVF